MYNLHLRQYSFFFLDLKDYTDEVVPLLPHQVLLMGFQGNRGKKKLVFHIFYKAVKVFSSGNHHFMELR